MDFRVLLVAVFLLTGCSEFNLNQFDNNHPIDKSAVKGSINKTIELNTQLADILARPTPVDELEKNPAAVNLDDRNLINTYRARQVLALERGKGVIVAGEVDTEELLYIWNLMADCYVDIKTILNQYTQYFSPSKMASFKILESKISNKGKNIERALLDLNDENSNEAFNLIMEQAALMNELFMVAIAR